MHTVMGTEGCAAGLTTCDPAGGFGFNGNGLWAVSTQCYPRNGYHGDMATIYDGNCRLAIVHAEVGWHVCFGAVMQHSTVVW